MFLLIVLLLFLSLSAFSSDYTVERHVINGPFLNSILFPGDELKFKINFNMSSSCSSKSLRVIGGAEFDKPFNWRGETSFRASEYFIDDNLDSLIVEKEKYSLYFKGGNDSFVRVAYYRLPGNMFSDGNFTLSLPVVKRNALKSNGNFGVRMEIFYKKVGRALDDIYDKPDTTLFMPLPNGTEQKYNLIEQNFSVKNNIACVLISVGGNYFEGECWIESPYIKQNGKRLCNIPFVQHKDRIDKVNYWVGVNLSSRAWPLWKLKINGKETFFNYIFDRASNIADFYLNLPKDLKKGDIVELSLMKDGNRKVYPYKIRSLEILEESSNEFEVISTNKFVKYNSSFGVLIETNVANLELEVNAGGSITPHKQKLLFKDKGLYVIDFKTNQPEKNVPISFFANDREIYTMNLQVIEKEPDNVILSSGDDVYINRQIEDYSRYFKWYVNNRIGNAYHFRPSYQWNGQRTSGEEVLKDYIRLLNQLKMPYAWQVDGRTLAGENINPSKQFLESEMFLGKQAHENDGGYYYWTHFNYQGLYSDIAARTRPYGGIFAKHRPIYTEHGTYIHYDPKSVKDMEDGAKTFVGNLKYSKGESTRHTGPSTLFRYFYQAGYDWLGTEQMYGPEDVTLSSLRGASIAYGKKNFGSLHAMQWGSGPFTDPKHSLRFYMSLALAYMHGSSHMNTEEGLWTDEYINDRYSDSGKQHLFAQHRMLDYIETHTRRGNIRNSIAVIQGRNDAWKLFGRGSIWSQDGEKWKFNKAVESFDLLKVFYPDSYLNVCGPDGWFSATPYGTIDLLPIEAPEDIISKYRVLIFLGWNTYNDTDFIKIRNFVYNGGVLLLSAAHLNSELQPDLAPKFPKNDCIISDMLGCNYRQMTGKNVLSYGRGKIFYFAENEYPIDVNLKNDYESVMHELAESNVKYEKEAGWIDVCKNKVCFSVWDSDNRRTIYLLNTEWRNDSDQVAMLMYRGKVFDIPVRRYNIETIHCAYGLAVHGMSNTTDILDIEDDIDGWKIKVQVTEKEILNLYNSLTGGKRKLDIKGPGIYSFCIDKE